VDSRDQFEIVTFKWWKIAEVVNASGYSLPPRSGVECKDKWGRIFGDFKCTFYYRRNNMKYYGLTPTN
jgi:hypothetical protein